MTETKTEKNQWIPVPDEYGRWNPEKKGDTLIGVYLRKEDAPFKGRDNFKYFFQTDNAAAVDGVAYVFGTQGLNNAMEKMEFNTKIKILYDGSVQGPDSKKKPFKIFKICYWGQKGDETYKKLYPDEEVPNTTQKSNASTMKLNDAPSIRQQIDGYIEIMESQFLTVTCEALIKFIGSDPDLDAIVFSRIKAEIVAMNKAGEINREKDLEGK